MRSRSKFHGGIKAVLFFILISSALGFVVMLLWNNILPDIFNVNRINFWQAAGLLILTRIFFGGYFRGFRDRHDIRHEMYRKWEKLTPEERQALFERNRRHFTRWGEWHNEKEQPGNKE
jgi:hypothetical protein